MDARSGPSGQPFIQPGRQGPRQRYVRQESGSSAESSVRIVLHRDRGPPAPIGGRGQVQSTPQTRQPRYLSATLRVAGQRPAHAGYAAGRGATRGASTIGGEEAVRPAAASPRRRLEGQKAP